MKKLLIVANWKANKTIDEATQWLKEVESIKYQVLSNLELIICPPFTLLYHLKLLITNSQLPITLAAQDVSPFPDGAYTGEVSARMLKDLGVKYVLIGHSERRKYFKEDEAILANKVREALDVGLTPIFCVQDQHPIQPVLWLLRFKQHRHQRRRPPPPRCLNAGVFVKPKLNVPIVFLAKPLTLLNAVLTANVQPVKIVFVQHQHRRQHQRRLLRPHRHQRLRPLRRPALPLRPRPPQPRVLLQELRLHPLPRFLSSPKPPRPGQQLWLFWEEFC